MTKTEQDKSLSKKEKEQILNIMANLSEKSNIKIETKQFNGYDDDLTRDDDVDMIEKHSANNRMYSTKYICIFCDCAGHGEDVLYNSTKELYAHIKKCSYAPEKNYTKQQYLTYLIDEYGEGYCNKCKNQVVRIVYHTKERNKYFPHGIHFAKYCDNCLHKAGYINPYIGNSKLTDDDR